MARRDADGELRRAYGEIFRFLRRHVNSREDAEDMTQAVFTAAVEHAGPGAPAASMPLLYTVASRRLVDSYRRRTRDAERRQKLQSAAEVAGAEYGPFVAQALVRALDGLSFEQRQVVQLRLVHGLSFIEVSEQLGITEGASKMRLRRALEAVRASLDEEGVL